MVDKILLDTNILLDYLLMREPFYDNASEIVRRCVDGIYRGCVAAHSISKIVLILKIVFKWNVPGIMGRNIL